MLSRISSNELTRYLRTDRFLPRGPKGERRAADVIGAVVVSDLAGRDLADHDGGADCIGRLLLVV